MLSEAGRKTHRKRKEPERAQYRRWGAFRGGSHTAAAGDGRDCTDAAPIMHRAGRYVRHAGPAGLSLANGSAAPAGPEGDWAAGREGCAHVTGAPQSPMFDRSVGAGGVCCNRQVVGSDALSGQCVGATGANAGDTGTLCCSTLHGCPEEVRPRRVLANACGNSDAARCRQAARLGPQRRSGG